MKFSTRTTYGLRAMVQLAKTYNQGSTSLSTIANRESISLGYLERIFARLKKSGLIESSKGANGGYALSQSPKKIKIFDIVKILEGKMSPFHCLSEEGEITCSSKCKCGATKVLTQVQESINTTLKNIRLSDLI